MTRLSGSNSKLGHRKAMGVHYTPTLLAEFLADRIVRYAAPTVDVPLRILDPACGDGALLDALLEFLRMTGEAGLCEVVGVEADKRALSHTQSLLERFKHVQCRLIEADFLDLSDAAWGQRELWSSRSPTAGLEERFDIVIANPPYVRTQVLGAERSQRLAARFGLTGRVDLYHAFLVAATEILRPGGFIGVITSNRFLSTLGGSAVRSYLARQYDIEEVIDLGDTKLFEAAVLPAIFIGRRRKEDSISQTRRLPRFIKVYSQSPTPNDESQNPSASANIFDILKQGTSGSYRVPQGVFKVTRGDLVLGPDPSQVWSLTTAEEAKWLDYIRAASHGFFGDIATVRVGIKTTADNVFIRSDWDSLPLNIRPESDLLRPLLRHEDACRWSLPKRAKTATCVLYPHEVSNGYRRPVDLKRYPRARAYLESNREHLEKRHYVVEAGRRWYEIWVPQDPDAWAKPKIVFPDISPEPRFYLDLDGHLVDGDCYWITLDRGVPLDTIYLLLAVANSSLMSRFHDLAFNNRLYSNRRRYITQYVAKYPYPDPSSPASRKLISVARKIVRDTRRKIASANDSRTEAELNTLVKEAFGLRSS